MLFSYESAMRELKRMHGAGYVECRVVKRWYGWIILDDGIESISLTNTEELT